MPRPSRLDHLTCGAAASSPQGTLQQLPVTRYNTKSSPSRALLIHRENTPIHRIHGQATYVGALSKHQIHIYMSFRCSNNQSIASRIELHRALTSKAHQCRVKVSDIKEHEVTSGCPQGARQRETRSQSRGVSGDSPAAASRHSRN